MQYDPTCCLSDDKKPRRSDVKIGGGIIKPLKNCRKDRLPAVKNPELSDIPPFLKGDTGGFYLGSK
jgi:hypothetical protein